MRLHRYFAWLYLRSFLAVFAVFIILVTLIDVMEQFRRFDKGMTSQEILQLSALNIPNELSKVLPLVVLLSAIACFRRLAKSSEMVVTRASGRSAIAALVGPGLVAILIGCVVVTIFNPIVAATSKKYSEERKAYKSGVQSVLSVGQNGLWLRQGSEIGQSVIHAAASQPETSQLMNVEFWVYDASFRLQEYLIAKTAVLADGAWHLTDVTLWPNSATTSPKEVKQQLDRYRIATNLTIKNIQDSFGSPVAISIWALPGFIAQLETAGFSARQHRMWVQRELARPLFFLALLCIAAVFTIQHARSEQNGLYLLTAILLAFGLFYIRNFAQVLGENGQVPVYIAAWSPPLAGLLLGIGLLLRREDG